MPEVVSVPPLRLMPQAVVLPVTPLVAVTFAVS